MSKYALINQALSEWAVENGLHWYTEYQDTEVRSLFLNSEKRDRVQIAVGEPLNGQVAIIVGQNERGLSRLHRMEEIMGNLDELPIALDAALRLAHQWQSESSDRS